MSIGALVLIVVIFIGALAWFLAREREIKSSETEKTRIVSTNPVATGNRAPFYMETTFMVYKKDGSTSLVKVKNGTPDYNFYMSKLET